MPVSTFVPPCAVSNIEGLRLEFQVNESLYCIHANQNYPTVLALTPKIKIYRNPILV